jgi:hypothetical protein
MQAVFYDHDSLNWDMLQVMAPNTLGYIDKFADSVLNVSNVVVNFATDTVLGILSSAMGGMQLKRLKSTALQTSAFVDQNRSKGFVGIRQDAVALEPETDDLPSGIQSSRSSDDFSSANVSAGQNQTTDATKVNPNETGVHILTKVTGNRIKVHALEQSDTEKQIGLVAATVFCVICFFVRQQVFKKRRRDLDNDTLQDEKPIGAQQNLSYDSEEDEDLEVKRSSSTWKRDWEDLFFWHGMAGVRSDAKPGIVLLLNAAQIMTYGVFKAYIIFTLEERIPVKCNTFITHAEVVKPTDAHQYQHFWHVLSTGSGCMVLVRCCVVTVVMILHPKACVICCDQILDYRVRVHKQPDTKNKGIEAALKVARVWFELFNWHAIAYSIMWFRPTLVHNILDSRDTMMLINYILNATADIYVYWMGGLLVGVCILMTLLMTDWVDVQASAIMAISPEETMQLGSKVQNVAERVHGLHWKYFKDKMHVYEVVVALFGLYYAMMMASQFVVAIPLAAMRQDHADRETFEWKEMTDVVKRLTYICSCYVLFLLGQPVLVNKHCDRLHMRINDLLMNITCSCEINDDSPESHSTSKQDRGQLVRSTLTLAQLQAFLDHCNTKSGMGVCIVGVRVTPKLAKMVLSAAAFVYIKCESYISDLLD